MPLINKNMFDALKYKYMSDEELEKALYIEEDSQEAFAERQDRATEREKSKYLR